MIKNINITKAGREFQLVLSPIQKRYINFLISYDKFIYNTCLRLAKRYYKRCRHICNKVYWENKEYRLFILDEIIQLRKKYINAKTKKEKEALKNKAKWISINKSVDNFYWNFMDKSAIKIAKKGKDKGKEKSIKILSAILGRFIKTMVKHSHSKHAIHIRNESSFFKKGNHSFDSIRSYSIRIFIDNSLKNWRKGTHNFPVFKKTNDSFDYQILPTKSNIHDLINKNIFVSKNKTTIKLKPLIIFGKIKVLEKFDDLLYKNCTLHTHASFKRVGKHYYLSIGFEYEHQHKRKNTKPKIAIDPGIPHTENGRQFTCFNGTEISFSPYNLRKIKCFEKKIANIQHSLAFKTPYSKGWIKLNHLKRKYELKKVNLIKCEAHKLTTKLTQTYDEIRTDKIYPANSNRGTVKNPGKNRRIDKKKNKARNRLAPSTFNVMLAYKCKKFNSKLIEFKGRTTKTCRKCGYDKNNHMKHGKNIFTCKNCGHKQQRDEHSAQLMFEADGVRYKNLLTSPRK